MSRFGTLLVACSWVLLGLLVVTGPAFAQNEVFDHVAGDSTNVWIQGDDGNEKDNPDDVGVGVVSPGDTLRIQVNIQNSDSAETDVKVWSTNADHPLSIFGAGKATGDTLTLTVSPTTDDGEVLWMPQAAVMGPGNTGDGGFAQGPTPLLTLEHDNSDTPVEYEYRIKCKTAAEPAVFEVWKFRTTATATGVQLADCTTETAYNDGDIMFRIDQNNPTLFAVGDSFTVYVNRRMADEVYGISFVVPAQTTDEWWNDQSGAQVDLWYESTTRSGVLEHSFNENVPQTDTYPPSWQGVFDDDITVTYDADNQGMGSFFNGVTDDILNPLTVTKKASADWLNAKIDLDDAADWTKDNIGYVAFNLSFMDSVANGPLSVAEATPVKASYLYGTGNVAVIARRDDLVGTDVGPNELEIIATIYDVGGSTPADRGGKESATLTMSGKLPVGVDNDVPGTSVQFTEGDIGLTFVMDNAGKNNWLNPATTRHPTADQVTCSIDLADMEDLDDVTGGGMVLFDLELLIDATSDSLDQMNWFPAYSTSKAPLYSTPAVDVVAGDSYFNTGAGQFVNCFIVDNSGNMLGLTAAGADTFRATDNIIPNLTAGSITIDHDWVTLGGDSISVPGDRIIAMVDLTNDGIGDEDSVRVLGDTAFGEDFFLADQGIWPDDTTDDDTYSGYAELDSASHIDGTESIQVYVVDDAGNVGVVMQPAAPERIDTDIPLIHEAYVHVDFFDNPEKPGVDGDLLGDLVLGLGDTVFIWYEYENDGLTDLVGGLAGAQTDISLFDASATKAVWKAMTLDTDRGIYYYKYRCPSTEATGVQDTAVKAKVKVTDDAGNESNEANSTESMNVDLRPPALTGAIITFLSTGDGGDGIWSIGDTLTIRVNLEADSVLANTNPLDGGGWQQMGLVGKGQFELAVELTEDGDGTLGDMIDVKAFDSAGNSIEKSSTATVDLDPDPPQVAVNSAAFYISSEEVGSAPTLPGYQVVNVDDEIAFYYYGYQGDIASVTVDASPYVTTKAPLVLLPNFKGWGAEHFGITATVGATGLDVPALGAGSEVTFTVTDISGNVVTATFFPEHTAIVAGFTGSPPGARTPGYASVDTDPPVTPVDQPIYVINDFDGNGVCNVGDRLDIVVNMGDPGSPGYDMNGGGAGVMADLGAYGLADDYMLTDDQYSAGGEGDGQFSIVVNNVPGVIIPGLAQDAPNAIDVAAGDIAARADLWAQDDDGNLDQSPVLSDVVTLMTAKGETLAVDTERPMLDSTLVVVTMHTDADSNGVANIGDSVLVTIDMTDAVNVDVVSAVRVLLAPWGRPSNDNTELFTLLTAPAKGVNDWTFTHYIDRTTNDGLLDTTDPTLFGLAIDNAGNFSAYDDLTVTPPVPWWSESDAQALIIDAEAPLEVTNLAAEILADGHIQVTWTASASSDVAHYMVYWDNGTGTVSYTTPIGGPIPANTTTWVSEDLVVQAKDTYLFAVRTFDDGGNDDGGTFWVTGGDPDDTPPMATLSTVPTGYTLGDGGSLDGGLGVAVLNSDGSGAWSSQTSAASSAFYGVWGSSASDVWATGAGGRIYRRGVAWNDVSDAETRNMYAVWGSALNNVYVFGDEGMIGQTIDSGATWSWFTAGGATKDYRGAWGLGVNDFYAVGEDGRVTYHNAGGWNDRSVGGLNGVYLYGVWGSATNDVFVVGDGGNIWWTGDQGSNWAQSASGTTEDLYGIWGDNASDVWAVGANGTILYTDDGGATWTEQPSGTHQDLYGVWGTDTDDIYAVGANGVVLYYDGDDWMIQESGTGAYLYGVWGSGAGNIYAVGDDAPYAIQVFADVAYEPGLSCQFRARRANIDPNGQTPGPWFDLGVLDETIPFEVSTAHLIKHGDDTYDIIARVYDEHQNFFTDAELVAKAAYQFTLDTTVPEVQILSVNGNPSPNGMNVSGTVPVVITAQDDVSSTFRVCILQGTELIHDQSGVTFAQNFTYSLDTSLMPAGGITITVYVYDEAGWVTDDASPTGGTASVALTVLDTHEPLATFTTPVNGQRVAQDQVAVQITATSGDVARVELQKRMAGTGHDPEDYTTVDVADNAFHPNYNFVWDASALAEGDYMLRGKVWDTSDNYSFTDSVTVTVDGSIIAVALSVPEIQTFCDHPKVAGTTVELIAEVPAKATVDIKNVKFYYKDSDVADLWNNWKNNVIQTVQSGTPGPGGNTTLFRATWNTTTLTNVLGTPEGWDVRVIVTDTAGNVTDDVVHVDGNPDDHTFSTTKAHGVQVWVDNSAPTVDLAQLTGGGNVFVDPEIGAGVMWFQNGDPITVESFVTGACDGEVWKVEYQILYGTTTYNVGMSTTGPNYAVTFDPVGDGFIPLSDIENGFRTFEIEAKLTDHLGNTNTSSDPNVYVLDVDATQAIITNPVAGMYIRGDYQLTAMAIDAYNVSQYVWEYTSAGDGKAWTEIGTTTTNKITWETFNDVNVPDGAYYLHVKTVDQHLNEHAGAGSLMVYVDNTLPSAITLTGVTESDFLGMNEVTLATTATDESGIRMTDWQIKCTTTGTWSEIASDDCAPFAYKWGAPSATVSNSGKYHMRVRVTDNAWSNVDSMYNFAYYELPFEVSVDACDPYACVTKINETEALEYQMYYALQFPSAPMTFYASAHDEAWLLGGLCDGCATCNEYIKSGVASVQFQVKRGTGSWSSIGLPVTTATEGMYSIKWDPGEYGSDTTTFYVRAWVTDVAGNSSTPAENCCPPVAFKFVDDSAPVVTIRGVDPQRGILVYTCSPADAAKIGLIEFRVRSAAKDEADWTIIGTRDGDPDNTSGNLKWDAYDRWEFNNWATGPYYLEARAFHSNYSTNGVYDVDPPTLKVQVDAAAMTASVLPSGDDHITLARRAVAWECEQVDLTATVSGSECPYPPVVVVYADDDPCDFSDTPSYTILNLEQGAVAGEWWDSFGFYTDFSVDPDARLTMIGTWWDATGKADPEIDAAVNTLDITEINGAEGTRGPVTAATDDGSVIVDIRAGAIGVGNYWGLYVDMVDPPDTPVHQQDYLMPVGKAYQVAMHSSGVCEYNLLEPVTVTIPYCEPGAKSPNRTLSMTVARWDSDDWSFSGIWDVVVNDNCTITFKTTELGIFSGVQRYGLNIANCMPFYYSRGYTTKTPILKAYITDWTDDDEHPINGVVGESIQAFVNGIPVFMGTASGPDVAVGWTCASELGFSSYYDEVSGLFAIAATQDNGLLVAGETNTFMVRARNVVGDTTSATCTFEIDETRPVVAWEGGYLGPDGCVTFTITDSEAGVDPRSIFLDFYGVQPVMDDTCCYHGDDYRGTEIKEFRNRLTPDALTVTEDTAGVTTVEACNVAMDLREGQVLEVVLYSARYCEGCVEDEDHDDVYYDYSLGVYDRVFSGEEDCCFDEGSDCSGPIACLNATRPITRRYVIDATPPEADLLTSVSSRTLEIKLAAGGAPIDESTIAVTEDGETVPESTNENTVPRWSYDADTGILSYTPSPGGVSAVIKAEDVVGNAVTFTVRTESAVVSLVEFYNDPNPFDPEIDGTTLIRGDLSKSAHVTAKIYDFAGNYVATLVEEQMMTTFQDVEWAGSDEDGNDVANGVYFCHIEADDGSKVSTVDVKIVVLRGELELQ